jgi:hypothetical protein
MEDSLNKIKGSMKLIVKQTNNILKHSVSAFRKTKEKILILDDISMTPSTQTKEWFNKRNIKNISIPDFFDIIFREASQKEYLDFTTRTIMFDIDDASVFGFAPNTKIPILDLFESLTKYFD